jgi:serine phosphatase RsbU (regulator of sigma subunit)
VFDGMGHGLTSAQLATLAVAAYRNARRNGLGLVNTAEFVHDSVNTSFRGTAFTTAVLVELDTQTGLLRWLNAGQPEPLLLRQGRLVRALQTAPMLPLGLRVSGMPDRQPSVGAEHLQPGDLVLMFTDGVPEARSPDGEFFGERRLVDLVVRNLAAGLPAPETMRRVVRALLDHQQGQLTDDATLLLLEWRSDNMHALVPADDLLPD